MASNIYVIDTNLFRYYTNKNEDQADKKQAAIDFWGVINQDTSKQPAELVLPIEVKQELQVQMHSLDNRGVKIIKEMIENLEIETFELPIEFEYELRQFSNYVIQKYRNQIRPNGYKLEYLNTSDARILVAAYLNEGVLVTSNIKDFIIYLLFTDPSEDRLYDYLNKQYVQIPKYGRQMVESDSRYKEINIKMKKLLSGD